jgi:Zn-dependent protease with chaperone function/Zn-finger nucleic acid-binding protein
MVEEAEAATGIRPIQPVILPTPGCNAFSLQDGKGGAVIGVTDGILSKLSRDELSAVVAHEAAHLVHEDSRLVTTACFLFGFFGSVNEVLGKALSNGVGPRTSGRRGGMSLTVLALWIISGVGYLMTKLIFMTISREREYLADADGVQICKDPLALAEGLYKISRRYRGGMSAGCAALFIMNPAESSLDEREGFISNLFSDHPPVSQRLKKLLYWAKSDIPTLEAKLAEEEVQAEKSKVPAPSARSVEEPGFMAYHEGQWKGPYTPNQLLAMGFMTPSSWVCPAGSKDVAKASEVPELLPVFQDRVKGAVTQNTCPRCKTPLLTTSYEGVEVLECSFCKGHLLRAGVLERLVARDERTPTLDEIKKARTWRDGQSGPIGERDGFPDIKCSLCGDLMSKRIHSMITQVVVDCCIGPACGAVWCDGGELEAIETLVQDAHRVPG